MSKPDRNLFSFTGDKAGNIWRDGLILFTPDVPRSERVVTLPADTFAGLDPSKWSDILKFSGVRGLTVVVEGDLPGGKEDCADFNNECYDVELVVKGYCYPHGDYGFTVKGGSRKIKIQADFAHRAKVCELDSGNWSDQSDRITTEVQCASISKSGEALRYRRLNATTPDLLGGPWKKKWAMPSVLRKVYIWLWKNIGKRIGF